MSELAAKLTALASKREVKTLIVDIERLPGRARVKHRGLTIEGDFWDLSGWKHTIGYRIHPDDVLEWPSTICFAAKWYETGKRAFHAAWEPGGADAMYQAAFDLYDEADMVITYNGVSFDNKHLQGGWTERQMGKPSSWKDIDLLKVARASLGWESKTLHAVCQRLGIPAKNDKYEIKVARGAMAGVLADQRRMKRYNSNDTDITGNAYMYLLPLVKSHPHVAPGLGVALQQDNKQVCGRCTSTDVTRVGTYTPGVHNYPEYRCNVCGGSWRATYESRGPSVRAL